MPLHAWPCRGVPRHAVQDNVCLAVGCRSAIHAVQCRAVPRSAAHCRAVPRSAAQYNAVPCSAVLDFVLFHGGRDRPGLELVVP